MRNFVLYTSTQTPTEIRESNFEREATKFLLKRLIYEQQRILLVKNFSGQMPHRHNIIYVHT